MTGTRRFSIQGIAGLTALIAGAAILSLPLTAAIGVLADKKSMLADRREAETSLADRIARDRTELMQDEKRYARSLGEFNAVAVAAALNEACAAAALVFQDDGLAANCSESSNAVNDGIVVYSALLTASGHVPAIFSAIDRIEPGQHVDQFIIEQPERQETLTLRLRFSDISLATEASE